MKHISSLLQHKHSGATFCYIHFCVHSLINSLLFIHWFHRLRIEKNLLQFMSSAAFNSIEWHANIIIYSFRLIQICMFGWGGNINVVICVGINPPPSKGGPQQPIQFWRPLLHFICEQIAEIVNAVENFSNALKNTIIG